MAVAEHIIKRPLAGSHDHRAGRISAGKSDVSRACAHCGIAVVAASTSAAEEAVSHRDNCMVWPRACCPLPLDQAMPDHPRGIRLIGRQIAATIIELARDLSRHQPSRASVRPRMPPTSSSPTCARSRTPWRDAKGRDKVPPAAPRIQVLAARRYLVTTTGVPKPDASVEVEDVRVVHAACRSRRVRRGRGRPRCACGCSHRTRSRRSSLGCWYRGCRDAHRVHQPSRASVRHDPHAPDLVVADMRALADAMA